MKTKKIFWIGIFLCSVIFFPYSALAQESSEGGDGFKWVVLATVNIETPKIVSQDKNNLKLSFVIKNEEIAQPGIKYGVQLMDKNTRNVVAEQVYPDVFSLTENTARIITVDYTAPEYLKGNYEVWIVSMTGNGLPLSHMPAGEILLAGMDNNYIKILPESCYLTIQNDSSGKKYTPAEGVDISKEENLAANCEAENKFSTNIEVTPNFETRRRTVFGKTISIEKAEKVTFSSQEKKTISVVLPKASEPQAYEILFSLLDNQNKSLSNGIKFHYVLDGVSATIQNIRLDKDTYQSGDTAQLSFNWTGSADTFPESRNGGNALDEIVTQIKLTNKTGADCANSFEKKLSPDKRYSMQVATLDVPIKNNCIDPIVQVSVKDNNGNVLDAARYDMMSKRMASLTMEDRWLVFRMEHPRLAIGIKIGVAIFVIVLLIFIIFRIKRKRRTRNLSSKITLLLLSLFGGSILFFANVVQATTITGYGTSSCYSEGFGGWVSSSDATYDIGMSSTSFQNGGTLTVSSNTVGVSMCSNSATCGYAGMQVKFNNGAYMLFEHQCGSGATTGSSSGGVESSAGNYNTNWYAYGLKTDGNNNCTFGSNSTPYTLGYNVCRTDDWFPTDTWNYCYNYTITEKNSCGQTQNVKGTYLGNSCEASTCSSSTCWNGCETVTGTRTCCDSSKCSDGRAFSDVCSSTGCNDSCGTYHSGTYTPSSCAASTCSGSTCWNGCSYENGNYLGDNSCRATTCKNSRCWNGCVWAPGGYLPSRCDSTTCTGSSCWDGCAYESGTYTPSSCAASTCSGSTCWNGCWYENGTATCAPTVSLSASSTSVDFKGSTMLSWSTTNYPTSCTATTSSGASGGDWSGSKSTSGSSETISNIKNSRTYTITCSNSAGSASASQTINLSCSPSHYCADPSCTGLCGDQPNTCVLSCTEDSSYCSGVTCGYKNCGTCSSGKWKEN